MTDFKFHEPYLPKQGGPVPGEVAIVTLPVQVVFVWSDRIVEDVDEGNNPVSYTEGFVMEVIGAQTFVYKNEPRITNCFTRPE
jgi:hypothetical protein